MAKTAPAPAPTLNRMGLQYCHFSCFLSDSVSLCFICWTLCAVLAILSSRCRFRTLKQTESVQQSNNKQQGNTHLNPHTLCHCCTKALLQRWTNKRVKPDFYVLKKINWIPAHGWKQVSRFQRLIFNLPNFSSVTYCPEISALWSWASGSPASPSPEGAWDSRWGPLGLLSLRWGLGGGGGGGRSGSRSSVDSCVSLF